MHGRDHHLIELDGLLTMVSQAITNTYDALSELETPPNGHHALRKVEELYPEYPINSPQ